jgi:CRP/FNR family transcriptional regulator, cyclic AMP receptor protein
MDRVKRKNPKGDITVMKKAIIPKHDRSTLIEETQWAHDFSTKQIEMFAAYMDPYKVKKGAIILHEGGQSKQMTLIARGEVAIIKYDSTDTPKVITTLGPGKTFGEMSLFDGSPHSATVAAATDTILLVLTMESFNILIQKAPRLGVEIVIKIAKLMSQYLRQTSGKLIDYLGS